MQIAIDGPVAAGKGTVSKLAAKRLGFLYVDTGALYRTVSVFCDREKVDKNNENSVVDLIKKFRPRIELRNPNSSEIDGRLCTVLLNGQDISWEIRTPEASQGSSLVSRYLGVRDYLLDFQRELATKHSVVMEGRDIGTFVLPKAEIKIFLAGKIETRAKRRQLELQSRGEDVSLEKVVSDIQMRDRQDMERPLRPLKRADDSIEIDTSDMTIEEVVGKIVKLVKERLKNE
ncbi:(d)CMP kinase [Candidatus Collierbacteria bacterium]|nr:(d)CMP kinase [Candidatus Collierbacteria bacterium]